MRTPCRCRRTPCLRGGDRQRHRPHEPGPRRRRAPGARRRGARPDHLARCTGRPSRASSRPTPTTASAGWGSARPYVKLLDYRVVSGGDVDPEVEARAIRDAVGAGAKVINLSLGGNRDPKDPGLDEFSRAERDAISYAVKRGTVVVAAVGNSPDNAGLYASWPAALRHVIGVSAVTQTLAWAPFSNTDPVFNDIAAPGRRHHHDRAPLAGAHRLLARCTPRTHDPGRRHGARHVIRGAPRERGGRGADRATPDLHADAGHVDPGAHGAPPGRHHGARARQADGLRSARRDSRGEARRWAACGTPAARCGRAERPCDGRAGPAWRGTASSTPWPTTATTAATSTSCSCTPATRCA